MPSTWRMRIVLFSIAISWISARPATGVLTPTRRAGAGDCRRMKAPALFCCGTVARTQGSVTLTCRDWASAPVDRAAAARKAIRERVMVVSRVERRSIITSGPGLQHLALDQHGVDAVGQ